MTAEPGIRADLKFGTIPGLLRMQAERIGETLAIEDGDTRLTFGQLASAAQGAAKSLIAIGVQPGDRVAIWAPNGWRWIAAALGAHSAGAAIVPINTRYRGNEAAYLLQKSRARVLLTVNGFLGFDYVQLLRATAEPLPNLAATVVLEGDLPPNTLTWDDFIARGLAIPDAEAVRRADAVKPDDLSDIIFTSGTTGHPKGVMCTHAQTLRMFGDWADVVGLRAGDRYLIVNPFFHTFGYKAGWLACLLAGAAALPHPVFDPAAVLERIGKDKVSVLPGPPTLYQTILGRPDLKQHDLSTLRLAVTGAATIPVELIHRMRRELNLETVLTAYGLTECTGVATICRRGDDAETIASTSGRAAPGVEVRVADPAGKEMPAGQPGEILVRGYNVMCGYFEDAGQTASAIDADGWLHTGDVGVMDARGYLRITDRIKDMFIVGGFNAYPAEIESVLLGHPSVMQAAVVGVPDERLGEAGVAFVVLLPGSTALAADELIAWARERMANYKVPRRIEFVAALPVNATGKVLKYQLRERARHG